MMLKQTLVAIALGAGLVAAQVGIPGDIPKCADPCVNEATTGTSIAGCAPLDIGCVCKNKDFLNNVACCLAAKCSKAEQATAVKYAQQICSSKGVTVPDSVVCNKAEESSASAAASASGSTTLGSTASASTGTATTGSATTVTTGSSSMASSTASGSATKGASTSGTSTGTATTTVTQSSAAATSTGAAVALDGSVGGLLGALVAMVMAL